MANIRRLAEERGISLNRVADFAGISRPSFFRVLNLESALTSDRLSKVAEALEVPPKELLEDQAAGTLRAADGKGSYEPG